MTDAPNPASPYADAFRVAPTTAEALAGLNMPLLEAMMTQRAVRRVHPDPVDDAVVLKCIELALRAPTGANGQKTVLPNVIPILPIRNIVVFPGTVMPLNVGRAKSKALLDEVMPGFEHCQFRLSCDT